MLLYEELSNKILRAYNNIENSLGKGLAEKVYENALCIEFDEMGVTYERQKPLVVEYQYHSQQGWLHLKFQPTKRTWFQTSFGTSC
jgi:GxxExxY protein